MKKYSRPFNIHKPFLFLILFLLLHCKRSSSPHSTHSQKKELKTQTQISIPPLPEPNPDSLFAFVKQQVQFGPRVPETPNHKACGDWLSNQFKRFHLQVYDQYGNVKAPGNKTITIRNIIAAYQPQLKHRIILSAHWDTRPFADQDEKDKHKPILGANDGASGVAILLEIARILPDSFPIGIDFILWDAEDMGISEVENSFCLGSQYWSEHPHTPNYIASYCINLDMVGGINAVFPQEKFSRHFAPELVEEIWQTATQLGYGDLFLFAQPDHSILDDHYYVYHKANIPAIDIIHFDPQTLQFFPEWHTHKDDLSVISKETLHHVCHVLVTWLSQYAQRMQRQIPS